MLNVKPSLDAIVLAAGRGSRFGGDKLLAPWRGGVLLEGALCAAFAAPVDKVHLVVGTDEARLSEAAHGWARRAGVDDRLGVIRSPHWADGLSASLKAGVAQLSADRRGVYIFLGDMPRIPQGVLAPLAAALAAGASAAVATFDGEMGHPALIGAPLFASLDALTGDRGARAVLERLGPALARIAAESDGVLFDVDTPQALAQA
ncbi:MAG: nucleotidyltransferase family protein [Caulobacteraceae bacterium]